MAFPILAYPDDARLVPGQHPGWNRADGACLIEASSDVEAVLTWLKEYRSQPRTLDVYRKEAERFLLWASQRRGKTLSDLTRDDVLDYDRFMESPDRDWCGPTRPRTHPDWKPFAYWPSKTGAAAKGGLSVGSRQQAKTILSNLYNYLVQAGYLRHNPFALKRGRTKGIKTIHEDRILEHEALEFLMRWLNDWPTETERDVQHAERARWLISLYYYSAARLREVTRATMGEIRLIRGQWWWKVLGKGEKQGDVPVNKALLEALKRYRQHLGLAELPSPSDTTPLVCSLYRKKHDPGYSAMSAAGIHKCMKDIMQRAADDASLAGHDTIAAQLRRASTHWLRHSSASHQLDAGVPLLVVSQNLRHAKLETTRRYLHAEDEMRHALSEDWATRRPGHPAKGDN